MAHVKAIKEIDEGRQNGATGLECSYASHRNSGSSSLVFLMEDAQGELRSKWLRHGLYEMVGRHWNAWASGKGTKSGASAEFVTTYIK